MIECPRCGCDNTDDSNFCKNCGLKLDRSMKSRAGKVKKAPAFAVENTHTNIKALIVVITVVLLIFCIVTIAFLAIRNGLRVQQEVFNDQDIIEEKPDVGDSDTGTSVNESKDSDVKVVNSGYSLTKDKYSNEQYLFYGLEFKNSSSKKAVGWAVVKVICRDKAGTVIDTYEENTVVCLAPGETGGIAFSGGSIKEEPKTVDIDFSFEDSSKSIYPTEDDVYELDIVDTKVTKTDDTFSSLTGDIVNNSDKQFEYGIVYILFKNDKGEILGGNDIYLDKIKKGKTAFSYDFIDTQIVTDDYVCYGIAQK